MSHKTAEARSNYQAAYYSENSERKKSAQRARRIRNHDAIIAMERLYRAKHGKEMDRRRRCSEYGITVAELDRLEERQRGYCQLCARSGLPLEIDHSHKTGKVRGLLCRRCNLLLAGIENSSVQTLAAALSYLGVLPGPRSQTFLGLLEAA